MSLIKCPSCGKQISNKAKACQYCSLSMHYDKDDLELLKVMKYRQYRDKMYRLKMWSYTAIALALFGIVPMVWSYVEAVGYGFNASITNHWGVNFVVVGFFIYVILRVMMVITKRAYTQIKSASS